MRYILTSACFLAVLLASACSLDDGAHATSETATAKAGQDLILDIGVARLVISGSSIGTGAGQLEPGSKVTLGHAASAPAGRQLYSPVIKVSVKDGDGDAVTGLNLDPPALFELSYDAGLAGADGVRHLDLSLLSISGSTIDELSFTTVIPAPDTQFVIPYKGRTRANFTSLATYAVGTLLVTDPPPPVTALTGTISTILTSTAFQLADAGSVFAVNLVVPTGDTTTPPTVVTLNDAAFDATNPLNPTNRIMTVQTAGKTYTTDHAAAGVVVQINTFAGTSSSGSMVGSMIEQGASAILQVNFTFTTGGAATTSLGGTVTDAAGRRTLSLTDASGDETVLVLMPDTFPNVALDPITFDDSTFDTGDPLNATARLVTVTDTGETFSSDVPVLGSVTLTFTSFDSLTLVGAGTITGTVVSATPTSKTLNYTFSVTMGSVGGSGILTVETSSDVASSAAYEAAVAGDGTDYVACWLSDVGTTNRVLQFIRIDGSVFTTFGADSYEPTVNLDPAGGFAFASNDITDTVVVGASGSNPGTATVSAIFYDPIAFGLYAEVSLGTGAFPRVQYHFNEDLYVIAWQSGADVSVAVFDNDGDQIGTTQTAFVGMTLAGLAAAGDATDEALITATDGSGVVGQYITVSTGALSGADFDISTSLGGGAVSWEAIGGQYLVVTQTLVLGFFTSNELTTLAAGTTAPLGTNLTLATLDAPVKAGWGSGGAVFITATASLFAVDSGTGGADLVANPVYGAQQGGLDVDTSADGPDIAGLGDDTYIMVSALGAGGIRIQPLTLTP